ncbi:MAG: anthranilate synthase component I, partial [Planctomycetota bacterium]
MPCSPDYAAFAQQADGVDYVPVCRRLISDTLTPVSGFHLLAGDHADAGPVACLFESVIGGEKVGRYSFLACEPFLLLEARGHRVTETELGRDGAVVATNEIADCPNPMDRLRDRVAAVRVAHPPELPPFVGGAIGYAGYDTVRYVEHLPDAPEDDRGLPDLAFAFFDHMVVFDNVQKTVTVIVLANVADAGGAELLARYEDACRRVDELVERLGKPVTDLAPADIDTSGGVTLPYRSNFTQDGFEQAVRKCV